MDRYDELVHKLLPPGARFSVVALRAALAQVLREQVTLAMRVQLEQHFPDLPSARAEIQRGHANLEQTRRRVNDWCSREEARIERLKSGEEARMRAEMKALAEREAKLLAREHALKDLLVAFEEYERWQDGEGDVTEVETRYLALRGAWTAYKERTSDVT